jgi:DNA-binding NarL/FixJ family response regulator
MLDVQFIVQSSFGLLQDVRAAHPGVRILVTSGLSDIQWERPLLLAGVDGYLSKSRSREQVRESVRDALDRRTSTAKDPSPSPARTARSRPPVSRFLHDRLSLREFQILCQVAAGRRLTETASRLGISLKSVSTYRRRLLDKMGFDRNAELIHYALRNGLIPHVRCDENS